MCGLRPCIRPSSSTSAPALSGAATEVPCPPPPPRGVPIRSIRIEAPTSGAATQLVSDLVPFARTDLVPLDDDRWEVRVEEGTEEELDAVLLAVARWAAACEVKPRRVLVDGRSVELPDPRQPS